MYETDRQRERERLWDGRGATLSQNWGFIQGHMQISSTRKNEQQQNNLYCLQLYLK